jgi:hypothetical protein
MYMLKSSLYNTGPGSGNENVKIFYSYFRRFVPMPEYPTSNPERIR